MFNREPTIIINGFAELVRQLLPLFVITGIINLPPDKLNGWNMIISLVLTFVSTILLRQNVVSPSTANAQIRVAIDSPSSTTVQQVINETKQIEESK